VNFSAYHKHGSWFCHWFSWTRRSRVQHHLEVDALLIACAQCVYNMHIGDAHKILNGPGDGWPGRTEPGRARRAVGDDVEKLLVSRRDSRRWRPTTRSAEQSGSPIPAAAAAEAAAATNRWQQFGPHHRHTTAFFASVQQVAVLARQPRVTVLKRYAAVKNALAINTISRRIVRPYSLYFGWR